MVDFQVSGAQWGREFTWHFARKKKKINLVCPIQGVQKDWDHVLPRSRRDGKSSDKLRCGDALSKRCELLKIFVICRDSCKKRSKIVLLRHECRLPFVESVIGQTLSNIPFVLDTMVNALWIHSQSVSDDRHRSDVEEELFVEKFTCVPFKNASCRNHVWQSVFPTRRIANIVLQQSHWEFVTRAHNLNK